MFRRAISSRARIDVKLDGRTVSVEADDSVAAALFALGGDACRTTPVTGSPRGPYCMMGVCFDCLVTIDGKPNQQACMISVRPGMCIELQHRADVFAHTKPDQPVGGSARGTS
jgi:D-hydroxyproline dehydrogenase subunit gamma